MYLTARRTVEQLLLCRTATRCGMSQSASILRGLPVSKPLILTRMRIAIAASSSSRRGDSISIVSTARGAAGALRGSSQPKMMCALLLEGHAVNAVTRCAARARSNGAGGRALLQQPDMAPSDYDSLCAVRCCRHPAPRRSAHPWNNPRASYGTTSKFSTIIEYLRHRSNS